MLIAQATVEGLALVSGDAKIRRYASRTLRVVS
jgi:PIN domain nuclease of toxin-antitoxin system